MDGKVDELEIKITADSSEAAASIERLTASLQRLQSAAKQTGLDRTSQQLKNVAKTPSMTKLERELARVERYIDQALYYARSQRRRRACAATDAP